MYQNRPPDISALLEKSFSVEFLVLEESDLGETAFDLSNGFLGELFQKLINYDQKVAFVISDGCSRSDRLKELMFEHRSHANIRFFDSQDQAREWAESCKQE